MMCEGKSGGEFFGKGVFIPGLRGSREAKRGAPIEHTFELQVHVIPRDIACGPAAIWEAASRGVIGPL